jgi:hypothetical protein
MVRVLRVYSLQLEIYELFLYLAYSTEHVLSRISCLSN